MFDSSKEEFVVIHRRQNHGDPFKLLGVWLDTKLTMDVAVSKVVNKAAPKVTALLRARRFHSMADIVSQYKTHFLCLLDGCAGAVFHASSTVLAPLDGVQKRFFRELDISDEDAFREFDLAPL